MANAENVESESDQDEEQEATDGFVDQFEAALAARGNNIWASGGAQKDVAIRILIQCFGSMIESHAKPDALPDFNGRIRNEDMLHRKLLDASKHVVKARQYVNLSFCAVFSCFYFVFSLKLPQNSYKKREL